MGNRYSGSFSSHGPALALFAVLATVFLWDVLLLDYSLGAFDIILNQPSWKGEFPVSGMHQPILSDSPTAHYPQREFEWGHARLLSNVELNPYMFTGMPWSAQGVGGFLTSLPQLFLDIPNAIDWSTWLRLVCAGFFMYLLVVELGLGRMAGVFAGILWTYSLHQVVWLEFPQHLATQLWIPLVFLLNIRVLRHGLDALSGVGLLLVNVLLFTSGYMQIVLYTYVTVGLFNTFYVLTHVGQGETARNAARWASVHAVYVAAVALCSAGLYAEMQSISEGLRGAQQWRGSVDTPELSLAALGNLATDLAPHLREVTHMLAPDYYGGFWSGRYQFERGNPVESARYFGVLGLVLATTALFAGWGTRHARVVAAFALTIAMVFSLVYANELSISALKLIPFADKGSYSRFITLLTFIGCVLAAYGFHCALPRRCIWLVPAVVLIGAYVLAAWLQLDELAIGKFWYPATVVAALLGAVAARRLFGFHWKWVGGLVVAVTAVDLLVAGHGFNTRMENDRLFPRNNAIRYLLNDPEPYRVAVVSEKPLYHPNILSYYDIPVVEGYLTVLPVDYARYMEELFGKVFITANGIMFVLDPNIEALRLMNVKYVLSDQPLEEEHDGIERVLDTNNHHIFRIRDHLPRVFCASDAFFIEDDGKQVEEYEDLMKNHARPVVLQGPEARETYGGSCRIEDLQVYTHGVTATVRTEMERYLAVPYAFNRNWRATVNGKSVEIVKANGYHMAIRIPEGESHIEIRYRNAWAMVSGWIFAAAGVGLLVFAWFGRLAGWQRAVFVLVGVAVIFKSSLSLPGIRNDNIPERAPPQASLPVIEQGPSRTQRETFGERITRDNPVEYPLQIDSRGLTRLSLLAGTFHQPRLEQIVTVALLDENGEVLVERQVAGEQIANNSWFTVDFPPIRQRTDLRIRVSTQEADMSKSFVLWFDKKQRLCIMSFYEP